MPTLYAETAFQISPSTLASVVTVQIPSYDGSHRKSKHSNASLPLPRDEKAFAKQLLANQTSIYFRQHKAYPRSFSWRTLEDDHILQIQCADLARPAADVQEAHITLRFEFQNALLPHGIALADHDHGDSLYVFVITAKQELHTLELSTAFFRGLDDPNHDLRKWCNTTVPSSFNIDHAHRLVAATPFELFISYDSGRLQRLSRTAKDPSSWTLTNYDDRQWGASLRTLFKSGSTLHYEGRTMSRFTAHAITISPDLTHAYVVCLDHTLRAWNLETGKLVVSKDLLNKERQPQDVVQLNPAEASFVRLIKSDFMSHPVLVTYSNQNGGQFKIWDVKGGRTDALHIEDKYPGVVLTPPDPDPTGNIVWSLTGFDVIPGDNYKQSEMWVLWRNNNYHRLYSMHFDFVTLEESWASNWVTTSTSVAMKTNPPDYVKNDAEDPTSKWLDFLLSHGRYPTAVLETALSIYEDKATSKTASSKKSKSLQERLASTIARSVILRRFPDVEVDYDRFNADTDQQWRNFWGTVQHIDSGRYAPLSLAVDVLAGMAWVAMADQCCVVRECSNTELLLRNGAAELEAVERLASERWPYRKLEFDDLSSGEKMAGLISAAATFRKAFSPELARDLRCALDEELLEDAEFPATYRLTDFSERVGLSEAVSNETFEQLEKDISQFGGFAELDDDLFLAILDTLPNAYNEEPSALRTTIFGSCVLSAGIYDAVTQGRQLVQDMLVLLIFLETELTQAEGGLVPFDAPRLFLHMLGLMREYDKNAWLISHTRLVPLEIPGPDPFLNRARRDREVSLSEGRVVTIMEDVLSKAIRPQPITDKPQSYLLTAMLEDIQSWATASDEMSPADVVYIQCDLLHQKDVDLATDFSRFQTPTAWATYVRGRLHLARCEFEVAAGHFQKASYALACGKAVGSLIDMSAGLLSKVEVEGFNNGLPRYFQHILSLFDKAKADSQAAHFARLALKALVSGQKEPVPHFRSEVLSRLFSAELRARRYFQAWEALIQFPDSALQKKCLISLVTTLIDLQTSTTDTPGAMQILRRLPIHVYPHLARHLDSHLHSLAKAQTSIPAPVSQWSTSTPSIDYLKLLHAHRIAASDYRGAVSVLLDRVRLIRKSNRARSDPHATELRHALLALINAMTCVSPDEAYILTPAPDQQISDADEDEDGRHSVTGWKKRKRIIVTLEDLRREYQGVLDRCSRIERGDFEFGLDGEDDEDGDDEDDGVEGRDQRTDVEHGDASNDDGDGDVMGQ